MTLVSTTAIYHNPSLTRDDNTAEDLYALFRTDRKLGDPPPEKHSATGAIYYRWGTDPGGADCRYSFPSPDSPLATNLWGLWAPVDNISSGYPLFTNYSTAGGPLGIRKILAPWSEGLYGMDTNVVTPR